MGRCTSSVLVGRRRSGRAAKPPARNRLSADMGLFRSHPATTTALGHPNKATHAQRRRLIFSLALCLPKRDPTSSTSRNLGPLITVDLFGS